MNTVRKKKVCRSESSLGILYRPIRVSGEKLLCRHGHLHPSGSFRDYSYEMDLVMCRYDLWRKAYLACMASDSYGIAKTEAKRPKEENRRLEMIWLFVELLTFADRSRLGVIILLQIATEYAAIFPNEDIIKSYVMSLRKNSFYLTWKEGRRLKLGEWGKKIDDIWTSTGMKEPDYRTCPLTTEQRHEIGFLKGHCPPEDAYKFWPMFFLEKLIDMELGPAENEVFLLSEEWIDVRSELPGFARFDTLNEGQWNPRSRNS